ncbi:tyrosine-type recombinase/integrase [Candidatus Nephthysia bennettiae]|uniref:Site-specific integrase n=1 Tax=Candidatus Nephthysia bennettiae TaxID=3127016 RepID=A0A934K4Q7_9BACT|nr:site-specific integrase [Candidatus Dormibacteraeota bacterium]
MWPADVLAVVVAGHHGPGIQGDPSRGLKRVPAPPDRTRALTREQVDAIFRIDVALRERTFWRLLYETAARTEEILALDVSDLDLANKRARVISKGGAAGWVLRICRTPARAHRSPRRPIRAW